MYKIAYILLVIIVTGGCSVLRPKFNPGQEVSGDQDKETLSKVVRDQNITLHNFFIQKAQIELSSNTIKETFLASVKFLYPDTFLISIRSKTGIEAARIYCSKDTILINDRINRKLFYGKPGMAGRKYGVGPESFPLILGDLISESNEVLFSDCVNGEATFTSAIQGIKIKYVLDCVKRKVVTASQQGSIGNINTVINFERFIRNTDIFYPARISVGNDEMKMNIRIDKMEYPWNGSIEFIHGKNYELIELL